MSEINANFELEQISANFNIENNNIEFTPTDIQLRIYTSTAPIAGGSDTNIQYNSIGALAGSNAFTFNNSSNTVSIENLTVTSLSNLGPITTVKIAGGTSGQLIQTDGAGNLSFTSANVANANYAAYAGNVVNASQSNITSLGNLTALVVDGTTNLGDVGNVTITGGTNGYVLQTDGLGNLSWTAQTGGGGNGSPGGSNTQIQYNDGGLFGGSPAFTFDNASNSVYIGGSLNVASNSTFTGTITGTITNATISDYANTAYSVDGANVFGVVSQANYAAYAGNITASAQSNITTVGNLTGLTVTGVSTLGNIGNVKITGGAANYSLLTDGTGNLSWVDLNGKTGNLSNVKYAVEYVNIINLPPPTHNMDMLFDGAITYANNPANSNVTLNFRGNSTTTFNSLVNVGQSITGTYLMTTTANAYGVTSVKIDNVAQTINWVGSVTPAQWSNSLQSYTFTILKTAATPAYLVLGSATRYGV